MNKFYLILPFFILLSCTLNQEIVENFIEARNKYDFKLMKSYLDDGYYETYLNDTTFETKNLTALSEITDWGSIMSSNTKLKKITSQKNTITTIEENFNFIDSALLRSPRTFKITYYIANRKIMYSKIDTLIGHKKRAMIDLPKLTAFNKFLTKKGIDTGSGMNKKSAKMLKKALLNYLEYMK